ncbi:MAG: hypothetical protein ACOYN0_04965 [Phycisphaerales bacterium]
MELVLLTLAAYLAPGLILAPLFAWRWAGDFDPVAAHSSLGFKLMMMPGAAALWPVLLVRRSRTKRGAT